MLVFNNLAEILARKPLKTIDRPGGEGDILNRKSSLSQTISWTRHLIHFF